MPCSFRPWPKIPKYSGNCREFNTFFLNVMWINLTSFSAVLSSLYIDLFFSTVQHSCKIALNSSSFFVTLRHLEFLWVNCCCVTFTSRPISSSGNCMMFRSGENLAFFLFSWRLYTELWFTVGCSRLAVVGDKVWVFLDISLWAGLAPTPSVGVLR